jgi:hypothetical protein
MNLEAESDVDVKLIEFVVLGYNSEMMISKDAVRNRTRASLTTCKQISESGSGVSCGKKKCASQTMPFSITFHCKSLKVSSCDVNATNSEQLLGFPDTFLLPPYLLLLN